MKLLALAALAAILLLFVLPASGQLPVSAKNKTPEAAKKFLMKEGTFLGFSQVNLSMGEIGFEVVVSSNIKSKSKPKLEFRIDKPKGKIIGTLRIPDTADTTYVLKLTGQLRNAVGVHDLYLVAKGEGEFNISGFSFISNHWTD